MNLNTTYLYFEEGKETKDRGVTGRAFTVTKITSRFIDIVWLDTFEEDFLLYDEINRCVTECSSSIPAAEN